MPQRSSYEGGRQGREDQSRPARDRQGSRYGPEGRSWDDNGGAGYTQDHGRGYSASSRRYGQGDHDRSYGDERGGRDYGQYAGQRQGYGGGGYGESSYEDRYRGEQDFSRRHTGASRDYSQSRGGERWSGSSFDGDYGQRGQGGFGSGGYDGPSQTGGSAGQQGSQHDFEPDYLHWREGQMRELDRDYHSWRDERRQKFSKDFDEWRSQRRAQGQSYGQGSTLSQAGGGYGADGDQGGVLQSNPQVTKVSGADDEKKN